MSLAKAARSMNDAMDTLRSEGDGDRPQVFISYARPDRAVVEQLAEHLSRTGYSPWWDDEVRAGEHFEARIIAALDAACAVIVLWSADSVASAWVKWEANRGLKQEKLVTVAMQGLDLSDIRPPFSDLNTLALDDVTRLLAALGKLRARRAGN